MHHNVAVDFSDETSEATSEVVIKDGAIVELIGYLCKKKLLLNAGLMRRV